MNEDFEHKRQGELLKLGLAEAKDGLRHIQSAVKILDAVADYYQRRKKQTGRARRPIESRHVACSNVQNGAGLKNSGWSDSGKGEKKES